MIYTRLAVFARFVRDLASLSKCEDRGVAAIIFDEKATQIYSIGINGGPKGGPDCLCHLGGKYTCIHAEANALAKCKVDCTGATLMCSLSPCVTCASLIVNAGIVKVIYLEEYKDKSGLEILANADVEVIDFNAMTAEKVEAEFLPDYIKQLFAYSYLRIPAQNSWMVEEVRRYCALQYKIPKIFIDEINLETVITI